MKAKTTTRQSRRSPNEEPVPHELGRHLFALIKRNLLARREGRSSNPSVNQLTFAF